MTQDDVHIFCPKEQAPAELAPLLRFVLDVLRDYGLDDFYLSSPPSPRARPSGPTRSGTRPPRCCASSPRRPGSTS